MGASNLECNGCEGSLFIFSLWRRSFSSLLSPNDSRPVVLSNSEMGVVFIPPVIILSPAFWVLVRPFKFGFSPGHIIQTPAQPVPALTLQGQAPGRVAIGLPVFKSLV